MSDSRSVGVGSHRVAFAIASALFFVLGRPGGTQAENRLVLPELSLPEGSTAVQVDVRCEHDVPLTAYSLSIRYDPAQLGVTSVTLVGTSAEGAEFFDGSVAGGAIVYGVLLDLSVPFTRFLPPATDHSLARIAFDVLASAGASSPLEFKDNLGASRIANTLTDDDGFSVVPSLVSGRVSVVSGGSGVEPLADAGPDQVVPEVSTASLDASGSRSPSGSALVFSWIQVSGPPATSLSGTDAAKLTVGVPPVPSDSDMVFRVTVRDSEGDRSDEATIRVVDLESRAADIEAIPRTSSAVIDGGRRAVVAQGRLSWQATIEDAYWTRMRFHARGAGNEASLLGGLRLYADKDDDGVFDANDDLLAGPLRLSEDDGTVEFTFFRTIPAGGSRTWFLVADVANPAGGVKTGFFPGLIVLGCAALVLGLRGRRGFVPLVLSCSLVVTLSVGLSACGGGGSSTPEIREVRFDLIEAADVGLQGASSGVNVTVGSLPLEGVPLEV